MLNSNPNMSTQISIIFGKVLDMDHKIITELEKEEPDISAIKKLYDKREKQIEALHNLKTNLSDTQKAINDKHKKIIKHQFSQINELENGIQKELNKLINHKKSVLESIVLQNKIKNSYTASYQEGVSSKSKHLDIKSI